MSDSSRSADPAPESALQPVAALRSDRYGEFEACKKPTWGYPGWFLASTLTTNGDMRQGHPVMQFSLFSFAARSRLVTYNLRKDYVTARPVAGRFIYRQRRLK
jgi:hypothetical protein